MKRPAPLRTTGRRIKAPPGSFDHDKSRIAFDLPADEYRRLLVAARARNLSLPSLVRRAVDAWLRRIS